MRNYTLRTTIKGSSLLSLLIITLLVWPIYMSCKFENPNNPIEDQNNNTSHLSIDQEIDNSGEIVFEESTWVCAVCSNENDEYETMCQQCNIVRQQEDQAQPQGDSEGVQEDNIQEEYFSEEEEELNEADPNKDKCPVCYDWFTKEQQAQYGRYFVCEHFICETCCKNMKAREKLPFVCPICKMPPIGFSSEE